MHQLIVGTAMAQLEVSLLLISKVYSSSLVIFMFYIE